MHLAPKIIKSQFVTHVSENWNQLVRELNTWLVFGRSLEREAVLA